MPGAGSVRVPLLTGLSGRVFGAAGHCLLRCEPSEGFADSGMELPKGFVDCVMVGLFCLLQFMIRGALYSIPAAKVWKINVACNLRFLLRKRKRTMPEGAGRRQSVRFFLKTQRTRRKLTGMAMAKTGAGAHASGTPSQRKKLSRLMWSR